MEKYMLPCMFKKMFGIDCIGCGIQRAIYFVFQGEFEKAFFMFPAIYTTILFFISIALFVIDKKHNYHKIIIFLAITNAVIMIVSYVYKMRFLY
jgi:multisubunit Na+/H+ antiporter MnhC subunit